MISVLIAVEEAGDQLRGDELRLMVSALVFAGQDATRNQLGCAMTSFVEHPAQWARLAETPALAARTVEEVMRVRSAVPLVWRVATEDFEFKGLRIKAGTFLSMFTATAQTDPRLFGAAEFDIGMQRPAQLSFGGGIHYSLGAALARAEMAEALLILASRLRAPELDGRVQWRPALGIYGKLASDWPEDRRDVEAMFDLRIVEPEAIRSLLRSTKSSAVPRWDGFVAARERRRRAEVDET